MNILILVQNLLTAYGVKTTLPTPVLYDDFYRSLLTLTFNTKFDMTFEVTKIREINEEGKTFPLRHIMHAHFKCVQAKNLWQTHVVYSKTTIMLIFFI